MKRLILFVALLIVGSAAVMAQHISGLEELNGLYYKRGSDVPYTGKGISLHENGEISGRFHVVNGRLDGVQEFFDTKGILLLEKHYKNGAADGDFIVFHEDGRRMKQRGLYWEDKPFGTWISFDRKGKIVKEEVYSAFGERTSERTF